MPPAPVLVLGGGNALGAYHAGAWAALEEAGVLPAWVVGVSIGAVMGALIAGTAPEHRRQALHRFWARASAFDAATQLPALFRQPLQYSQALANRAFGWPPLFTLRPPDLGVGEEWPGLFDTGPMRRLLTELVDFDRLNGGAMRFTVAAVDLASGEEVVWDTTRQRVEIDHVMASAALIPDFQPVKVDGRLMVDGGLGANLPIHLVLEEALATEVTQRLACFAVDLFPLAAPLPRSVLQAAQRQSDLLFASQTHRALLAMVRRWEGREPGADLFITAYNALEAETALKGFDFSRGSLDRRSDAGLRDMRQLVALWRAKDASSSGLGIERLRSRPA